MQIRPIRVIRVLIWHSGCHPSQIRVYQSFTLFHLFKVAKSAGSCLNQEFNFDQKGEEIKILLKFICYKPTTFASFDYVYKPAFTFKQPDAQ